MTQQPSDPFWDFKHDIDMRVVLDPIADELMYRIENPVPVSKAAKRKRDGKRP